MDQHKGDLRALQGLWGHFWLIWQQGRLSATVASMSTLGPKIKDGKLRILAISGNTRSKVLPDMPTVAEQGVPGYNYINWAGVLGPAGMNPAEIVKTLVGESPKPPRPRRSSKDSRA